MVARRVRKGVILALVVAGLVVGASGGASAVNTGPEYGTGTVTATIDPALGELAEAPPGYPTDPKRVSLRLRCTSAKSCVVTSFSLTEGRTNPLEDGVGPLPLSGTKTLPQPVDDQCPVETTVTSNLKLSGKRKIGGKPYPGSVSGTVVFAWPVGEYDPPDKCGGETWTYTFTKATPTGS